MAAYYGHKDSIKQMVSQKLLTGDALESECAMEPQAFKNVPQFVLDVTLAVRFQLTKAGLLLNKGSKQSLVGFFRPMPPSMQERACLCVVYETRGE